MPAWTNRTWAEEALRRAIVKLREAGPGTRNDTLFLIGADVANYVADGSLDGAYVESVLLAEAGQIGLTGKEAWATLRSALQRGDPGKAWYPSVGGSGAIPGQERKVTWGGRVLVLRTGKPALADEALASIGIPLADVPPTVRVTWYTALREVQGDASEWSWAELAEAVEAPMEWPGKKDAIPLWSLAEIEDDNRGRKPNGLDEQGREKDRDPETYRIHGLVLDYDDEPTWSLEQVRRWWGEVQHVAHSSASHNVEKDKKPAHGRGRVILALSRPVTVQEYARVAEWVLHAGKGFVGATELRATRRAYYVPARAPGGYCGHANVGRAIDVDALLGRITEAEKGALEEVAADEPDPATWGTLELVAKGEGLAPRDHLLNLTRILDADPRWVGRLKWSDFVGAPELDGRTFTDEDEGDVAVWVGQVYGLHPPMTRVHEALRVVCHRHRYHPVREYLDGLVWDGVERLDQWLSIWAGCEVTDDGLTGIYGRKWAISAVARVYDPGCKVDNVLVLQGGQGIGKSRILRAMAGPAFYSDSTLAIGERDGYQSLRGVWIFELGELDSVRRSDWSAVKAFLSAQVDRFRPSYGRNTIEVPRQVVFAGSTNEGTFLGDSTGSRRFWVRKVVEPTSVAGLEQARDQLWAEAVHRYRQGEQWWLNDDEEAARRVDSEQYQIEDPWAETIGKWLDTRSTATVTDILRQAIGKSVDAITKGDEMRVTALLTVRGWFKGRVMVDGVRVIRWSKP